MMPAARMMRRQMAEYLRENDLLKVFPGMRFLVSCHFYFFFIFPHSGGACPGMLPAKRLPGQALSGVRYDGVFYHSGYRSRHNFGLDMTKGGILFYFQSFIISNFIVYPFNQFPVNRLVSNVLQIRIGL